MPEQKKGILDGFINSLLHPGDQAAAAKKEAEEAARAAQEAAQRAEAEAKAKAEEARAQASAAVAGSPLESNV